MVREKHWPKIGPISLTSNGTNEGLIEVADTCGLYVKMTLNIKSDTEEKVNLEVKRVLSRTQLILGPKGKDINTFSNLSAFTTADNAYIFLGAEQKKPNVPREDREHAMWAHEPINARRVHNVDCYGNPYTKTNPLPVEPGNSPPDTPSEIKSALLCAEDVIKDFTWAEIDGVQRVTKIEWTSAALDAELSKTIKLTRDFTYLGVDPYTLDKTEDTLDIS